VNAVSPGFFYTELIDKALSRRGGEEGMAKWHAMESRQGRRGLLEELGDAVTMLSAPGMAFVNGHNLVVDKYVPLQLNLQ
jgi:NAD(P)-dependent dehydrogenase (short-subunit alcohol dehydrogenase family)